MKFVKPTAEQIEKILQSDKSFCFVHVHTGSIVYTLSKSKPSAVERIAHFGGKDFYVYWKNAVEGGKDCNSYSSEEVEMSLARSWHVAEEDLAQLEDTSKRHKHYDIIKQWIEDPDGYDIYVNGVRTKLLSFNPRNEYRLEKKKPKVKKYKVLFRDGEDFGITVGYYANEEEFQEDFCFDFIQLIQESEKEF